MSNFVTKYAGQYDSDEEISERFTSENAQLSQVYTGKAIEHHQIEYEQALREREEIERQIASLCTSGIPRMSHNDIPLSGYRGTPRVAGIDPSRGIGSRGSPQIPSPSVGYQYREMNSSPTAMGSKYGQANIAPEHGYLSPPAHMNPYYDPYARNMPGNRPMAANVPPPSKKQQKQQLQPPSQQQGKQAKSQSAPSDLPVIKIRGFGRSTPPSGHAIVYSVQFKRGIRQYVPGPRCPPLLTVGEFVITQCTRGENMGVVTEIMSMQQLQQRRYEARQAGHENEEGEGNLSQIIRVAHRFEKQALPAKYKDEVAAKELTVKLAKEKYGLDMNVIECEYQFDRERLTIYYSCENRVDFRELVKELCATLMIRIWMKEITKPLSYALNAAAAEALATGVFTA